MSETSSEIDWKINFSACFRPLAAKQEVAIEGYLGANIRGLTSEEMDRAVANLCDTWDVSFQKRQPNVRDIKIRILTLRKRRGEASAAARGIVMDEDERNLRAMIRETKDPEGRFDFVCEGTSNAMCQRLERFAATLPGGVKRPTLASLKEIIAPVVESLTKIAKEQRKEMDRL